MATERVYRTLLPNSPLWDQARRLRRRGTWLSPVVVLGCPAGSVPLAARGLAAVLARPAPAGAGGRTTSSRLPLPQPARLSNWRRPGRRYLPFILGIVRVAPAAATALRFVAQGPTTTGDPAIAACEAARTKSNHGAGTVSEVGVAWSRREGVSSDGRVCFDVGES
jgi:hypothetical protein